MLDNEILEQNQQLKNIIEQSVDDSVNRAFKKYGLPSRISFFNLKSAISLILALLTTIGIGLYLHNKNDANEKVTPVENHDLTLENNGIFGFTVADFEEAILGEATRQKLLIVEEREVYVNTTITETGLFNLGVFNKQQVLTIHGLGQYTIDLTTIASDDISLNEDTYELTIRIPHAELHQVNFIPEKTEIGDTKKGWLAFGSIKMDAEQHNTFEVRAKEELSAKLNEAECFEEADRFAKLSAYETYQPIIKTISPAYKVVIEFK